MRLFVAVLLVTLALCCYEANAVACPDLVVDLGGFFSLPDPVYRILIQKYNAPEEAVDAKMQVKQCANELPLDSKLRLTRMLTEIVVGCAL